MRCLRTDGMNYMAIIKTIDFLYRRMESCQTMAEKEEILELIFKENKKIKQRNNLEELEHARDILHQIATKYVEGYNQN